MARSPSNEAPHTSSSASIAPWANKDNEVKQPSLTLKEIQEIEAEQQRNKEAYEAEQRRQLMAQQAANQPPPPALGPPSTATGQHLHPLLRLPDLHLLGLNHWSRRTLFRVPALKRRFHRFRRGKKPAKLKLQHTRRPQLRRQHNLPPRL